LPDSYIASYKLIMKILFLTMLATLQPVAVEPQSPPPAPTDIQQRDLSCVAVFAIIASEQERGVQTAFDYPLMEERGRTYMAQVGATIMSETGRSREQVAEAFVEAVAAQQAKVKHVADPGEVVDAEMERCLPVLDAAVPPKPKPTLNQCAVMLQLAYEEIYGREGLSKTAQDLKTLAAVLDNRARERLRTEGYSGNETDITMTQSRESMLAEAEAAKIKGEASTLDFEHCFTLAAPEEKDRKYEH
jgi:hypothetical protein